MEVVKLWSKMSHWPKIPHSYNLLEGQEGHKILQNLHLTFVLCNASQK